MSKTRLVYVCLLVFYELTYDEQNTICSYFLYEYRGLTITWLHIPQARYNALDN